MTAGLDEVLARLPAARTLGVVSDTHGNQENAQRAVRMLESFGVDAVLHCGDIGSPSIPAYFRAWPTYYVLGNVDHSSDRLAAAVQSSGGQLCGRFASLRAARRNIAWLHGDDTDRLAREIRSGQWDLICHGHTHQAELYQEGTTWVLNPGALHRANPPSVAVVELSTLAAHVLELDSRE